MRRSSILLEKPLETNQVAIAVHGQINLPRTATPPSGQECPAGIGWAALTAVGTRRAIGVSFVLAVLVQVSGINTVIGYAPRIFQSAGWTIDTALLSTFLLGTINLAFTFVSFWVIDRFGRKPCYIVGSIGMAVALSGLLLCAWIGQFTGVTVLLCVLLYLAFFASCIGPVFWTLVPEIFPNSVRGEAMTVPVLTQWLADGSFPGHSAKWAKPPPLAFSSSCACVRPASFGAFYRKPRAARWRKSRTSGFGAASIA
jgi:SP family arabinose:H+ symporter-like MFS transporter